VAARLSPTASRHRDARGVGGWQTQYRPEPTQAETTVVAETTGREGGGVGGVATPGGNPLYDEEG